MWLILRFFPSFFPWFKGFFLFPSRLRVRVDLSIYLLLFIIVKAAVWCFEKKVEPESLNDTAPMSLLLPLCCLQPCLHSPSPQRSLLCTSRLETMVTEDTR